MMARSRWFLPCDDPEHAEVANGHPHAGERGLRPALQREVRVLEEIAEHVVTRADLARCFRTRPRHTRIIAVG